jgi:hypothetical protein
MKKVIYLLLIVIIGAFSLVNCVQDTESETIIESLKLSKKQNFEINSKIIIGKLINNKPTITYNKNEIIKFYDQLALLDDINVEFTHCEIKSLNIKNEKQYYGLFVYNKNETIRSITVLVLMNKAFGFYIADNGGSITCTTTACSNNSGCTAVQKENDLEIKYWTCSDCYDGKCSKSTTVTF